jgi:hypothetical protein
MNKKIYFRNLKSDLAKECQTYNIKIIKYLMSIGGNNHNNYIGYTCYDHSKQDENYLLIDTNNIIQYVCKKDIPLDYQLKDIDNLTDDAIKDDIIKMFNKIIKKIETKTMSKINLKDNIWIEGFDTNEELYNFKNELCIVGEELPYIYIGKTFEIPEELAKELVENDGSGVSYKDYDLFRGHLINFLETAKESIQSACKEEFCVIYKTN